MNKLARSVAIATVPLALTACGHMMGSSVSAPDVPAAVAAPAGHTPTMMLTGVGLLTYECRAKAGSAGAYEWVFAGPDAELRDRNGTRVGKYYGGPTWEHNDGSKITGKQLAVSPGGSGNIPLQIVQTSPATGSGAMSGVTYIQRVNTKGGVAPAAPCDAGTMGRKQTVNYSADYVFYKQ